MELKSYAIDSVSILFLSLMRKEHTNCFRFSMELREPVDPEILQDAVNVIWRRFPSVVARIQPDFFYFRQVQMASPPVVKADPGMLVTMTRDELENAAFRVYYQGNTLSIEVFHVLTDGFGAITTIVTLAAEYLRRKLGVEIPTTAICLNPEEEPTEAETEDSFLPLAGEKPWHLPSRFSYLPPKPADTNWAVRFSSTSFETRKLLAAAHKYGVTLNTLLSAVMASNLMQMQLRQGGKKIMPVRIMVPANLRKLFGSKSLRNFALYGLPTMEPGDQKQSLQELCLSFDKQLKAHFSREKMAAMSSYNVRMQSAWYFKALPWKLKAAAMRIGYRFFGESNSSLTLTNLGVVKLPEEMEPYVSDMQVHMTPRAGVPYGCAILSFGDKLTINMSKFTDDTELEEGFFGMLREITEE